MDTAIKPYLTLKEFADYIGRGYGTVWTWCREGRVRTEQKQGKRTLYRVSREAAEEAKKRLESGLWV